MILWNVPLLSQFGHMIKQAMDVAYFTRIWQVVCIGKYRLY